MNNRTIITEKIQELIELSKLEKEPNVSIVLLALSAARISGDDDLLASKVQEYVKDVLLPNVVIKRNQQIGMNN